jgi:hypothetical protein
MVASSSSENSSNASTAAGVIAFQISAIGRVPRAFGCTRKVSPCSASAVDRFSISDPTSGPIGQSGSRHRTRSDRPLRSARAAADGAYSSRAAASRTR